MIMTMIVPCCYFWFTGLRRRSLRSGPLRGVICGTLDFGFEVVVAEMVLMVVSGVLVGVMTVLSFVLLILLLMLMASQ